MIEFLAVNGFKRPKRLSAQTRKFAYESLNHKYGKDTWLNPCVVMDDVTNFSNLTKLDQYDLIIRKIVEEAPIRVVPGEKVSGSATLGCAIWHKIPAKYKEELPISSISHLTIDFESILKRGINGIKEDLAQSLKNNTGSQEQRFLKSCQSSLDSFDIYHKRYLAYLQDKEEYKENYNNLLKVPYQPASSFKEAVQSIWFVFSFVRLTGNWPGFGRIDYLLGNYLKEDLAKNLITIKEAREFLAHFFIKGCEWVTGGNYGSGDAQHYQNIVLAGIDSNGKEITNEVTYLVLDIIEETGISDFPIAVRINKHSPKKLLKRISEIIRLGGGIIAIYNEDLILKSLIKYGYPKDEVWKFANDGCWEVQIPGKTFFMYSPFDALTVLQSGVFHNYEKEINFDTFEDLYSKYKKELKKAVKNIFDNWKTKFDTTGVPSKDWNWREDMPCTVPSLFEKGCIEKGKSYLQGGPIYNVVSPHIGGIADIANSLYAIKKFVFEENKMNFKEFINMLKANYEGFEVERQYLLKQYQYYGNDNDEVDLIAARILKDFANIAKSFENKSPYLFPPGVSTFGRQIEWAPYRLATPHGHKAHEILAGNSSPTPGSTQAGPTSLIKSYAKADLKLQVTGTALDVPLLPSSTKGPEGIEALTALIKGFVKVGGFFFQPDVVDASALLEAQKHPENYQNLSIRVSGWNARFVTLNKEWQDMVIERNK